MFLRRLYSTSRISQTLVKTYKPIVAKGVKGEAHLLTGNFAYFTIQEVRAIERILEKGKAFVLVFDRDSIAVPANERAMWIREHFKHHANLEVRVAYNPPSEQKASREQFSSFIQRQLPSGIKIKSVRCNHQFSPHLAEAIGAVFIDTPELKNIGELEVEIKKNPKAHKSLLLPYVARRAESSFGSVMDENEFIDDYKKEIPAVKQYIDSYNTKATEFYARTRWDLTRLNQLNYPYVISHINDTISRAQFSFLNNVQMFDMPIYMPGQGWKIPLELTPYRSVIAKIAAAESLSNNVMQDCNAYITIDSGVVFPHGYARRDGLHVDGFLTKANSRPDKNGIVWGDNTYIVSDRQELQTELYPGPFDLKNVDGEKPQEVLKAFADQGKYMHYVQYNAYDIVRLTTNNVHAVHPNLTGEHLPRCFLKMTFSERLFNRGGNTINPNFNYRFMYVPREAGRNTQNFSGLVPEGFSEVDLKEINFASAQYPSWVMPTQLTVYKKPEVYIHAHAATEGESLNTVVDAQVVTTNIARAGDMKVTRIDGDSYFLGKNFRELYQPVDGERYKPTSRTLKALPVSKNVSFLANWGARQNIPAGGYIVEDAHGDKWGVHPKSFEATYKVK